MRVTGRVCQVHASGSDRACGISAGAKPAPFSFTDEALAFELNSVEDTTPSFRFPPADRVALQILWPTVRPDAVEENSDRC